MTLLGIELSDAGIIVAGGRSAKLLAVDGQGRIATKKQL